MASQETFLRQKFGASQVRVLKTYDARFAQEAFDEMNDLALDHLASALAAEGQLEPEEAPETPSEYADFLWSQVIESAREHDQISSFFVVTRANAQGKSLLYVSGDWPSAESYVQRIAIESVAG